MKPVCVTISSTIDRDGMEEKEVIQQTVTGQFENKEERWFLRYREQEGTEEETRTTVKANHDEVVLIRHGAISYRQTYRPGSKSSSLMKIPNGTVEMIVHTHTYERTLVDGRGVISFSFALTVGEEALGEYRLKIEWMEVSDLDECVGKGA
ncbi:DUF1934 domain-containing protein [Mechercharimyces sp. CAU 1602]|uniref:DUF1934 domain-containing protein n=1 Tax=Mechercharimyces sp. CAU 1602 TaxID=2973933 RepID=UPI0021637282|nr:DUF1934 domain-containing protein [Mechercharimyces sp. CAU 1602]MCS1352642.1 DUF1934 domain-containing protein [Mechercharimyces sp. CAU 1602]